MTQECVEKLIKKDMIDPVTGDKLSDKDIIPLQRVCVYFCGVDCFFVFSSVCYTLMQQQDLLMVFVPQISPNCICSQMCHIV